MNNYEIITKLIGEIVPVCDSGIDKERLENLKETCGLVDDLVVEIFRVGRNNRKEASVQKASKYANRFLSQLHEDITDHLQQIDVL